MQSSSRYVWNALGLTNSSLMSPIISMNTLALVDCFNKKNCYVPKHCLKETENMLCMFSRHVVLRFDWVLQHPIGHTVVRQRLVDIQEPCRKAIYIYVYIYMGKHQPAILGKSKKHFNIYIYIYIDIDIDIDIAKNWVRHKKYIIYKPRVSQPIEWRWSPWNCMRSLGYFSTISIHSASLVHDAVAMASWAGRSSSVNCPHISCKATARNAVRSLDVHALRRNSGYSPAGTISNAVGMCGW